VTDGERGDLDVDVIGQVFREDPDLDLVEQVIEHATLIPRPCPPPTNQLQVMDWSARLFTELRPS
jgi:hypothetical protein